MKPAEPEPPVPRPDALKPTLTPAPANDSADGIDEALLDSSLDLKLGLQVEDVAESISSEDFDSLFGRL
jgi:hypothetical protein